MRYNKFWRVIILAAFVFAVGITAVTAYRREANSCMGVPVLTEKQQSQYTENIHEELSGWIVLNGESAAVDVESRTIYIPQKIADDTRFCDLKGTLSIDNPNYKLAFGYDEAFNDLEKAAAENHGFRLYVSKNGKEYSEYRVVFTNLPVIRMVGSYLGENELGKNTYEGDICIWTADDPESNSYTTKKTNAEWHIRGDTVKKAPKRPWKVNLRKADGSNNYENIAGLGEDDDWILNPMYFDDTNLREKTFMDLWNSMALTTEYNYKMDTGEYVEVVTDGVYCGVYLLMRKVDGKYLELNDSRVVFKGRKEVGENPAIESYYTPEGKYYERLKEDAYSVLSRYHTEKDYSVLVMDNWIDVNLFMQFGAQTDNYSVHNMFYIADTKSDTVTFSLWDTDFSYGVYWQPGIRYYDPALAERVTYLREDYSAVKAAYPQLEAEMCERWQQLRKGVLEKDNIHAFLDNNINELTVSGALAREYDRWGFYHQGKDTAEGLKNFIDRRLVVLDDFYGQ